MSLSSLPRRGTLPKSVFQYSGIDIFWVGSNLCFIGIFYVGGLEGHKGGYLCLNKVSCWFHTSATHPLYCLSVHTSGKISRPISVSKFLYALVITIARLINLSDTYHTTLGMSRILLTLDCQETLSYIKLP